MKTYIVTGSCGLVGQEICNLLLNKGHKVIGIDKDLRSFFFGKSASIKWVKKILTKNRNYIHYSVDIRNKEKLKKILKKFSNFSSIIHCAAQPSHDWAKKNPLMDFDINARSTLILLELLNQINNKASFVYLSTNKVYGDKINYFNFIEKKTRFEPLNNNRFLKNGIDESMSIDQSKHSLFGSSKLSADIFVQEYGKYFGIKTVCFRCGCLTGPMHSGAALHGFLSYLVKCYVNNKTYNIIGYKGKQVRDNLHSVDLSNAIWEFLKNPKVGAVYNLGGGNFSNCSIIEVIKLLENIGKKKMKVKFLNEARSGDHRWWVSSNKKFKKDYPNWKQLYNIDKIIRDIYAYLKNG